MQIHEMVTDETLRSTLKTGTSEFPIAAYLDALDSFPEGCVAWHWHRDFEFSVVLSGPVCYQLGTEQTALQTGDCLFIGSGTIHRFSSEGGGLLQDVLFAPEFLAAEDTAIYSKFVKPVLDSKLQYRVFRREDRSAQRLQQALSALGQALSVTGPLQHLHVYAGALAVWDAFFPLVQGELEEKKAFEDRLLQARMQLMLDFISREYQRPIPLDEISAAANISKSEALRCFRKSIQTSPGRYLTDYRLEKSRELLRTTSATVSSIALDTGFRSGGYLSRVFKTHFGITPEAYRKLGK